MNSVAVLTPDTLEPFLKCQSPHFRLVLYLKDMKCGHCAHKISKAISGIDHILDYEFEVGARSLTLTASKKESFLKAIQKITEIGFTSLPVTQNDEQKHFQKDQKIQLKKMAVAAVCAGNIMLFSSAVYFGAPAGFRSFFHWLCFFLSFPVILFSAQDIWLQSYSAIKNRRFNLDLPIGLSLSMGFLLSTTSLLGDQNHLYFDSMAMVVFVILVSRFFLNSYVGSLLGRGEGTDIPGLLQARRIQNQTAKICPVHSLKWGDVVEVQNNEVIPVDGEIISQASYVDESLLTGESHPVKRHVNSKVFAGTRLVGQKIWIRATHLGKDSRVGKMINLVSKNIKTDQEEAFEWASRFTLVVLVSSLTLFGFFAGVGDWNTAFTRAFTMILIACPCAVSFGIPLIRKFSGELARENGILVPQPQKLKLLAKIKNLILDKTGTLTYSEPHINEEIFKKLSQHDQNAILSLEAQIEHPISRGFKKFNQPGQILFKVENFHYQAGEGISGIINSDHWKAVSFHSSTSGQKILRFTRNNQVVADIPVYLGHKKMLPQFFKEMAQRGNKISILSGDNQHEVEKVAALVPSEALNDFQANTTPESKEAFVSSLKEPKMMIGDGFNDIAALSASDLGVTMPGALENSLKFADISLLKGDLQQISKLYRISEKMILTERNLFVFTSCYNLTCLTLAALGYLSPVFAVLLMPASTLAVLMISQKSLRSL